MGDRWPFRPCRCSRTHHGQNFCIESTLGVNPPPRRHQKNNKIVQLWNHHHPFAIHSVELPLLLMSPHLKTSLLDTFGSLFRGCLLRLPCIITMGRDLDLDWMDEYIVLSGGVPGMTILCMLGHSPPTVPVSCPILLSADCLHVIIEIDSASQEGRHSGV